MSELVFILGCLLSLAAPARSAEPALNREQQMQQLQIRDRQLLLEQRRALLESHRRDLQAAQDLRDKGLLSPRKYRLLLDRFQEAQLDYDQAEILLEQTKLELLKNAIRLVVVEARPYTAAEGWSMVDIALQNQAEPGSALLVNPAFSPEETRTLLRVENIYVSLLKGPIIGEPYERRVPSLEAGETRTLTFRLLQESADIVVSLRYLDTHDEQPILFKQNPAHALPTIAAAPFSQVGELGREVLYDLTLERPPGGEQSFALALLGLPSQFPAGFLDQGAAVSQVRFADQATRTRLSLEVELPATLDAGRAGQTMPFFALVTVPSDYTRINALQARYAGRQVPEEELRRLKASYTRLELTPRGMGRLELLVDSHVLEVTPGLSATIEIELANRGSAAVRDIRPSLLAPPGWQSDLRPELIPVLEPGARQTLQLLAQPTAGQAAGDHEFAIGAQGQLEAERVEAPEEHLTIHLDTPTNWTNALWLLGALVALMAAAGVVSIRLARN
ncbi:MAG: hypothetical protein IT369_01225 [Candidatus Latescibacteria bacterium]|nr:hypothetical protein [Candidatus Latescibacterota bacterium]